MAVVVYILGHSVSRVAADGLSLNHIVMTTKELTDPITPAMLAAIKLRSRNERLTILSAIVSDLLFVGSSTLIFEERRQRGFFKWIHEMESAGALRRPLQDEPSPLKPYLWEIV